LRSSKWSLSFSFTLDLCSPVHATWPSCVILLYLITRLILVWSTDREAPHYVVVSSRPDTCLSALFSNTLILCCSLSEADPISLPCGATARSCVCLQHRVM
jgi:hypothetical protein